MLDRAGSSYPTPQNVQAEAVITINGALPRSEARTAAGGPLNALSARRASRTKPPLRIITRRATPCHMTKAKPDAKVVDAEALTVPERILLGEEDE